MQGVHMKDESWLYDLEASLAVGSVGPVDGCVVDIEVDTLEDVLLGALVVHVMRPLATEIYLEVVVDIAAHLGKGGIGSELCRKGGDLPGTCNFGGPEGSRWRGNIFQFKSSEN